MLEHIEPQPVSSDAYQALTDVNCGFEQVSRDLQSLEQFNFFPAENVTAWLNVIGRMRAEICQKLMESLTHREMTNAAYYDGACLKRERRLRDPNDVLMEAEQRKQESAKEEQSRPPESPEGET